MRVAAVAVAAVLCATVLRRGAPEFSMVLVLAAGVWILCLATGALSQVLDTMQRMAALAQLDSAVVEPVVKTVAISILTKVTVEICRSAGEGGVAAFVETAGTALALAVALPLAEGVVIMMSELLA